MSQNLSSAAVVIGALKVKNTIQPVSAGQGKRSFFCGSFVCFLVSCVSHAFVSGHCCPVITCWERADLLALVCDV